MIRTNGWAMVSMRPWFVQHTRAALRIRHLLIQDDSENPLPAARTPLLLDTVGMLPIQFLSLLVAIRQAKLATAAIVAANDGFTQRMLLLCPPVRLVMTKHEDLGTVLPPLTRVLANLPTSTPPIHLGLEPLPVLEPALSPSIPDILLAALQRYKHNVTARKCGMSRATLYRVLAETKIALDIHESTSKTPPDILAQRLIAAFQASAPQGCDVPSRLNTLEKLIPIPRHKKPLLQFQQRSFFETMYAA